jgi:hypothetical protein
MRVILGNLLPRVRYRRFAAFAIRKNAKRELSFFLPLPAERAEPFGFKGGKPAGKNEDGAQNAALNFEIRGPNFPKGNGDVAVALGKRG